MEALPLAGSLKTITEKFYKKEKIERRKALKD